MSDVLFAFVTFPSMEKAAEVTRTVVEEGLVAGGNMVPGLRSIYRWEGKVYDEAEVMTIFQVREVGFATFVARIKELHPYQVPEIVAFPVVGYGPYLDWVRRHGGS
jgi:periplasmic divalent cation tolerance protein